MYRCDGADAWVAVTVQGDAEWARARRPPARRRRWRRSPAPTTPAALAAHDDIDAAIARWTSSRPPLVAAKELQAIGVAACPAFTNRDLVLDEHLAARGFIVSWDHPDVGRQRYPGSPFHFERTPVTITPTPLLGEHNRDVLASLGYDDEAHRRSCTRLVSSPTTVRTGLTPRPTVADRRPDRHGGGVGEGDVQWIGEQAQVGGRADGDAPRRPGRIVERREVQVERAAGR